MTSTNRDSKTINLCNDISEVPRLYDFVRDACASAGLDDASTFGVNLAVEEAVVNVMDYAYPLGQKGTITVEATADGQHLTFVISDEGKPFDPTAAEEPDTSLPAQERDIGGLGIFLVRHYMDSVSYMRKDGQNILHLSKKL